MCVVVDVLLCLCVIGCVVYYDVVMFVVGYVQCGCIVCVVCVEVLLCGGQQIVYYIYFVD